MRHNVFGRKLNRDIKSRQTLFKNLIISLIDKERIETTEARAKAVRGLVDKLINKAKTKTKEAQINIQAFLGNKNAVEKLVNSIAPRFSGRASGFTRIIRLDNRKGDNAPMVQFEFVEQQEKSPVVKEKTLKPSKTAAVKENKGTTRRKSGHKTDKGK